MRQLLHFLKGLAGFARHLPEILKLLLQLPRQLWLLLRYLRRYGLRCPKPRPRCKNEIHVPPDIYRRADPMLYSQPWLLSMGLSVTWDNPDIQLFRDGVAVSSGHLQKNTEYEVRVRVWNNSFHAPAPGLPVYLSYHGFGAGLEGVALGKKLVDLGAKGTSQCPAFASFVWKTPAEEGHYCLQARLEWADDANPNNNLGQENTNVGALHSPAFFGFKVKNTASVPRRFLYEADDYQLPAPEPCEETDDKRLRFKSRIEESRARWAKALATQGYGKFSGLTADWEIRIEPEKATLDPGEETNVKVAIEPKKPGFEGRKAFNINVFALAAAHDNARRELVGGVTLYVEQ